MLKFSSSSTLIFNLHFFRIKEGGEDNEDMRD